jgi:hypothetical protein
MISIPQHNYTYGEIKLSGLYKSDIAKYKINHDHMKQDQSNHDYIK